MGSTTKIETIKVVDKEILKNTISSKWSYF